MTATANPTAESVCAADEDVPIGYMQRTRDYYLALGYDNPYRWAHFVDVPFTPLRQPLAASRLALISTAAPYQPGVSDQGPGQPTMRRRSFIRCTSGQWTLSRMCVFLTSATIVRIPPPPICTLTFPWRVYKRPWPLVALVLWRSALTAPPRTAASA